jgi:hypothetical protein
VRADSTYVPSRGRVVAAVAAGVGLLAVLAAVQSLLGHAPDVAPAPPPVYAGPAAGDVTLKACTVDRVGEFAGLGRARAELGITNGGGGAADYTVRAEFLVDGLVVGDAVATAHAVGAGRQVEVEAVGHARLGAQCRVSQVTRVAAAG